MTKKRLMAHENTWAGWQASQGAVRPRCHPRWDPTGKPAGALSRFEGRWRVQELQASGPTGTCWGVRGWQWVCGGSSRALWLSHKKQYCFHKSSHVHACFPLHPDLCDCGMRMCGKEALEDELLFFGQEADLKVEEMGYEEILKWRAGGSSRWWERTLSVSLCPWGP